MERDREKGEGGGHGARGTSLGLGHCMTRRCGEELSACLRAVNPKLGRAAASAGGKIPPPPWGTWQEGLGSLISWCH